MSIKREIEKTKEVILAIKGTQSINPEQLIMWVPELHDFLLQKITKLNNDFSNLRE